MKAILVILFGLFLAHVEAQASFLATHCSNSNGTIRWESGHNSNTITLDLLTYGGQTPVILPLSSVKITFNKEVTIEEKVVNTCHQSSRSKVYAGKVTILEGENKFETAVICTFMVSNPGQCEDLI